MEIQLIQTKKREKIDTTQNKDLEHKKDLIKQSM